MNYFKVCSILNLVVLTEDRFELYPFLGILILFSFYYQLVFQCVIYYLSTLKVDSSF